MIKKSNLEKIENRRFGILGVFLSLVISIFFFFKSNFYIGIIFFALSIYFIILTILNAKILGPLNKVWIRLGVILSKIFNPIILGFIFYICLVPMGLILKLTGRDELLIKDNIDRDSYWIKDDPEDKINFRNQF